MLKEIPFPKLIANEKIVEVFQRWLDLAKEGRVQAVGLVGVRDGRKVATEYLGISGGYYHELVSGVATLQHRILSATEKPE